MSKRNEVMHNAQAADKALGHYLITLLRDTGHRIDPENVLETSGNFQGVVSPLLEMIALQDRRIDRYRDVVDQQRRRIDDLEHRVKSLELGL